MKIIALTTSHNRKSLTLRALASLQRQALPADCTLRICLVDDGSTDGTGDAVCSAFSNVTVLRGSGDLFWSGGMHFGWEHFVQQQVMDYLLVFNDDVDLHRDALEKLLSSAGALAASGCDAFAVTGAFKDSATGETAYGGVVRNSFWHPLRFGKLRPADTILDCDTLNMNFTLISNGALNRIGFLSKDFTHARADYDFGLRLRESGGRVVLAPGYMGECGKNTIAGTSLESDVPFRERWKRLTSIKEQPPRERAVYYRRHGGALWPIYWLMPYLRVFLGGLLRR